MCEDSEFSRAFFHLKEDLLCLRFTKDKSLVPLKKYQVFSWCTKVGNANLYANNTFTRTHAVI